MMNRSSVVIDTNVLIVANGRDTHASNSCKQKALKRLLKVR